MYSQKQVFVNRKQKLLPNITLFFGILSIYRFCWLGLIMWYKIFHFEVSWGLLKLRGCYVTFSSSILYPSPWGQLTPCGCHVAPPVIHIVSVHFFIRLLMYTLPVLFHYLDHKLKVLSLVTDSVEWDCLHLFLPLQLPPHFMYPSTNVRMDSWSDGLILTLGDSFWLIV